MVGDQVDCSAEGKAGQQEASCNEGALEHEVAVAVEALVTERDKAAHQDSGMRQSVPEPARLAQGGVEEKGGDQDHEQGYSAAVSDSQALVGAWDDFPAR